MSVKTDYLIASIGKCNYWIIPKCGSTSILYKLIKLYYPKIEVSEKSDKDFKWVHKSFKGKIDYITPTEANLNGKYNFSFIRDPIERFISIYKDLSLTRKIFKRLKNKTPIEIFNYLNAGKNNQINMDLHTRSIDYYLTNFKGDIFNINDFNNNKLNSRNFEVEIDQEVLKMIKDLWRKDYTYLNKQKDIKIFNDWIDNKS